MGRGEGNKLKQKEGEEGGNGMQLGRKMERQKKRKSYK